MGPEAVQLATPTLLLTTEPQDVVTQLLPLVGATGLQLATALAGGLLTVHRVAVKLLPATGETGVQV